MVRVTTWSKREIIKELVYDKTLTIREISCENDGLVDFYFQIYDASSEPADGSTHMKFSPILVPSLQRFSIIFDNKNYPNGFVMSNGMYICASTAASKYSKTPIPLTSMCCDVTYEENTR
jgi:hypothetical protein